MTSGRRAGQDELSDEEEEKEEEIKEGRGRSNWKKGEVKGGL